VIETPVPGHLAARNGDVVCRFREPWRNGTTQMIVGMRLNFVAVGLEPGGGYFVTAPGESIIER
jgi:hypothetical protein